LRRTIRKIFVGIGLPQSMSYQIKNSVNVNTRSYFEHFDGRRWWYQPRIDQFFNQQDKTVTKDNEPYPIVSMFDILDHPKVQMFLDILTTRIEEQFTRQVKYPIRARIKTLVVYIHKTNGNLSEFHRNLEYHKETWGPKLGYKRNRETGEIQIPAYKTLYKFMRKYLGPTIEQQDVELVLFVITEAKKLGIDIDKYIIADSTPYESSKADYDATVSGHYKMRGYKEQRILSKDTDVPLAYKITKNTKFDGAYIRELLEKLLASGCQPTDFWGDGHYATKELLPSYWFEYGLHTHFKSKANWKQIPDITDEINRVYQKLWKIDGFKPTDDETCTLDFKLRFIWKHTTTDSHRDLVSNYFVRHIQQWETNIPEIKKRLCNFRQTIECGFGVEKKFSNFKLMEWCTFTSWKSVVAIRTLLDWITSIFWMHNGRTVNLTSTKSIV